MIAESQTPVLELPQQQSEPVAIRPMPKPVQPLRTVVVPVSWYSPCKRLFDVMLALAMLIIAVPIILLAALLVRLTSRGPVFYSQTRVGRGGRPFTIWKIRSMYHNCEAKTGAQWSVKGDPRVTPIGRFLRRSHIDELPQLWNILKGDMTMVGPRPERPEFVPQLEMAIPRYRERLLVLPGVTGLAQVHLGGDTDLASVERKLAMDLYYVQNISLWYDIKVVIATAFHVLKPFCASRFLFGLTPQKCAEMVGSKIRGEVE